VNILAFIHWHPVDAVLAGLGAALIVYGMEGGGGRETLLLGAGLIALTLILYYVVGF